MRIQTGIFTRMLLSVALVTALWAAPASALTGGTNLSCVNGSCAISGQVGVANGGTGQASLTIHGVLIGNTTSGVNVTSAGTSGTPLLSGGAGADPAFGALDLSVTGNTAAAALPISRGGTNATTFTASNRCVRYDGTALVVASGDCSTPVPPVESFGSIMDITTSQTLVAGFAGGVDVVANEGLVQVPSPAATYKNLRCVNSAIQGASNNVVITARVGACGSQSDGSLTCTITGTTGGNQACNDTTNTASPTAGQCIDFKIVTPATLTANARVGCTVERTA